MPTEDENKAIFRRYVEEVINQGHLKLADEIFDQLFSTKRPSRRMPSRSSNATDDVACASAVAVLPSSSTMDLMLIPCVEFLLPSPADGERVKGWSA